MLLLLRWLGKAIALWIFLGSILLAFAFLYFLREEVYVKIVSLCFQLVGFLCSLVVLYRTEVFFKYPSFLARIKTWIIEFPFYKRRAIHGEARCDLPMPEVYGEGHQLFSPKDGDLVDRVKLIEDYISYLDARITHFSGITNDKIRKVRDDIYEERNFRIQRDEKIESMLRDNAIGSVVLVEMSIAYFVCGAIASCFSLEIANSLR
jgi:hypothetical protein